MKTYLFNKIFYFSTLALLVFNSMAKEGKDLLLRTTDSDSVAISNPYERISKTNLKPAQQRELDKALSKLKESLEANTFSTSFDKMEDLASNIPPPTLADRLDAEKLFRFLDANQDRVEKFIDFTDLVKLPVGLSKNVGDNTTVTLGVLQAEFKKDYAELKVFVRIQFRVNDGSSALDTRDLFFGIDKLKFTNQGGFDGGGTFRAVLLGDFVLPHKNWTVVLRGGLGVTSTDHSKTYVEFDCNEFKSASLDAQIVFPRCTLLPYDTVERKPKTEGRVAFDFRAAINNQSGMRGVLATFSAQTLDNGPFCVPGAERFGFKLTGATYDQNDFLNASDMFFPAGYQGDQMETWNGVFIRSFEVFLPKSFTKEANENEAGKITCLKSFGGKSILIDRTGFTGTFFYNNECKQDSNYVAQKWKFTLNTFELSFLQSQFQKGTFGGGVSVPIHEADNNQAALINYNGIIEKGDKYTLALNLGSDLPITIKALRSKGKIYTGSWVKFEYYDDKFYPSANLSGEFSVGTKVTGNQAEVEATPISENETASFKGLKFYDLAFQTKQAPYVTIKDFEYQNDAKLANFPVTITTLKKRNEPLFGETPNPNTDVWVDFGFAVSLAQDRFSGSTNLVIKTSYEDGRLKFKGLKLTDLYVQGSTTALDLKGAIVIYENSEVKGFKGFLKVKVKKPFIVEVEAKANFGYQKLENYRYGFVDAYAALDAPGAGIPTGLGDLLINGVGMGVYFNMQPYFKSTAPQSLGCNLSDESEIMTYCPNKQIPFGFKVALGLKNVSESFRGRVNLDFALDRKYGINSISLYGSGVFGGKFDESVSGGNDKSYLQNIVGKSVEGQNADQLSNFSDGNEGQNEMVQKAATMNSKKTWDYTKEGDIAVAVGFMLNIPQKTLHAEAEVFINKGKLVGIGTNGRVGRAVLHWGKDDILNTNQTVFYIHAGYPTPVSSRMGITYNNIVTINAYLMIGWGVPPFPLPPKRVIDYLELQPSEYQKTGQDYTKIKEGNAFALGAALAVDYTYQHNSKWKVVLAADAGFDVLVTDNDVCRPDAWLARGQLYGYGQAVAYRKEKRKADIGVGFWLRGNGLKPFGAAGDVKANFEVLGIFDLNVKFGFKLGDVCTY